MCFSRKKQKPADQKGSRVNEQPGAEINQPPPNQAESRQVVGPSASKLSSQSNMKSARSIIHSQNKQLMKSQVSVREIQDQDVENMFDNARTQRVELYKTTNEHTTYVRKADYFDMSQGVHAEPNSRANLENANYQTALGNEVLTPPVYRYFYDQDAWNILNESQAI